MKRYLLALTLIGLAAGTIAAEVPGTTWDALLHRQVIVTYTDGTRATGTLALVKSATISLIESDGSVVTLAKAKVEAVRAVTVSTESSSTSRSKNARAGSSASMAMGKRDAYLRYRMGALFFLGGLGLGIIGVGLSYIPQPTPAVTPNPAHVNVSSYIAGYRKEAEKLDHRSAWMGFGTRAAVVGLVLLMLAYGISQSNGIVS